MKYLLAFVCLLTVLISHFSSANNQQHDLNLNNKLDKSLLNMEHKQVRINNEAHKGKNHHAKRHRKSKPQIGHRQQLISNQNNHNQPHRRRSRLLNIADNWDKIPYILQTYK